MIEVKNVYKNFGHFEAVKDVSITIPDGIIHGIIGENGAGKTTIIKSLIGVYGINSGEITLDGETIYENPSVKQKIGYIADNNEYLNPYSAKDMIKFYANIYPTFSVEKFHELNEVFRMDITKKIRHMSKGQQMRTSIMLNLATCPRLLVMDEPTSGLDLNAKQATLDMVMKESKERNMSVFISSHHLAELEHMCDEVTILRHGVIKQQDTMANILKTIRKYHVIFLEEAPEDFDQWPEFLNVEKYGCSYHIITNEYTDELKDRMLAAGADKVEELRMELAEVFSYSKEV